MQTQTAIFALALAAFSANIAAATIANYNGEACAYQGAVGRNGKPQGHGALTCKDGRRYTGQFQNGAFHGQGRFSVPDEHNLVLAPFGGMRSGKLRGMELEGRYRNGLAQGRHKVRQNGQHVFSIDFEQGQITAVTAP